MMEAISRRYSARLPAHPADHRLRQERRSGVIVDTSAWIAVLRREADGERFVNLMLATPDARVSAGTLLETRIVVERDGGSAELEDSLKS